ncbi:hypothetical protein JW905_03450 [bacterium]|nr:hypothetical protein [candidate division CSSED10-310 bacterium]
MGEDFQAVLDISLPEDLASGGPYVFYAVLLDAGDGSFLTGLESAAFAFI